MVDTTSTDQKPDNRRPGAAQAALNRSALLVSLVPIGLFVVMFAFLFWWFAGAIEMKDRPWTGMVKLLVIFAVAGLSALGARALMTPLLRASQSDAVAGADPNNVLRGRMAPFVLALGGAAIVVLALALIIAFAVMAPTNMALQGKIDSVLLGIFASVLPILATWVGTVLAFYFTNDAYEKASQAATAATAAATAGFRAAGPKVTERMIPFEKIAKIKKERKDARTGVTMAEVHALMKEPVTRVVIFDPAGCPIFVIRKRLYPSEWTVNDKLVLEGKTVQSYLEGNGGANATDAALFGFVAPGATLDEARAVMRETRSADVFVTLTGQKSEAALGWLTDDLLK